MSVLILYQFSNHEQLIDALCYNLNQRNIEADSFNITTWNYKYYDKPKRLKFLKILTFIRSIPIIKELLSKLLFARTLIAVSSKYDIVDIHYLSKDYDELIYLLKQKGLGIKITLWGSDFYRADESRLEYQRKIYQSVDIIQIATSQMQNDFLTVYPECSDKIRLAHFGIIQFETIDELLQKDSPEQYKKEMGLPKNKIILTCGTNGSDSQQHILILKSIEKLAPDIKERIFLIIPMTYGALKTYTVTVREKLNSLGMPYKLLSSSISMSEICKIRIVSDIVITIQKTDALSAAVQEHIFSGNILIAGDWLPYQNFNEAGIFYINTSLASLTETISQTVINKSVLLDKCRNNAGKIADFSSWEKTIPKWLVIYKEMIRA